MYIYFGCNDAWQSTTVCSYLLYCNSYWRTVQSAQHRFGQIYRTCVYMCKNYVVLFHKYFVVFVFLRNYSILSPKKSTYHRIPPLHVLHVLFQSQQVSLFFLKTGVVFSSLVHCCAFQTSQVIPWSIATPQQGAMKALICSSSVEPHGVSGSCLARKLWKFWFYNMGIVFGGKSWGKPAKLSFHESRILGLKRLSWNHASR